MVGSSLVRLFKKKSFKNLILKPKKQLDLLDQNKTFNFLKKNKPDAVIIAAAKVGGINANNLYRADYIYQNIQIQNNLIHGSYLAGVKKLIFLGSSCIYPKYSKQPIKEEYLLTSSLEFTNEPYAIAKIAGVKMCENYNKQYGMNYLSLMPCNLYGLNDNYDPQNSHFLPALISKIYQAKKLKKKYVTLWGNGTAKRELMNVDDLSNACLFFLNKKTKETLINIGSNEEYNIKQYANKIMKFMKYKVDLKYDKSMPNGTPRKILDTSCAKQYGWYPKISFENGFQDAYLNFLKIYKKN